MKVYVVNGFPGVGKTSFEKFLCEIVGEDKCVIYSSIDFVKEVAKFCGWDGTKDEKSRRLLSELKRSLTLWNDVPYKMVEQEIEWARNGGKKVMLIDCREPDEIHRFCKEQGAQALVIRRSNEHGAGNYSDMAVLDAVYDFEIWNDGSLEDLRAAAREFCKTEGLI